MHQPLAGLAVEHLRVVGAERQYCQRRKILLAVNLNAGARALFRGLSDSVPQFARDAAGGVAHAQHTVGADAR